MGLLLVSFVRVSDPSITIERENRLTIFQLPTTLGLAYFLSINGPRPRGAKGVITPDCRFEFGVLHLCLSRTPIFMNFDNIDQVDFGSAEVLYIQPKCYLRPLPAIAPVWEQST
jgi:hypothetical protein